MRFDKKNSLLKRLVVAFIVMTFIIMPSQAVYADVSLAPAERYSLGGKEFIYDIISADVNNDGNVDFVISGEASFSVLLGDGKGGFIQKKCSFLYSVTDIAVYDMNNDGYADVILSNYSNNFIRIYYGDGSGQFSSEAPFYEELYGINGPYGMFGNDFNKDNIPDLVIGSSNGINVLLGKLENGRWAISTTTNYLAGNYIYNPTIADFNNDGYDDIVAALDSGGVCILTNNNGSFTPSAAYCANIVGLTDITCGDFNEDGKKDIAGHENINLIILNGVVGGGLVDSGISYELNLGLYEPYVVDINEDGHLDICGALQDDSIGVFEGNGDSTFKPAVKNYFAISSYTKSSVCVDYNKDGALDIATVEKYNKNVVFFKNIMLDYVKNINISSFEQRIGTINDVVITVATQGVTNLAEIKASLVNANGTNLTPIISDVKSIVNNSAVLTLHIPDTVALGNYKIKVEVPGKSKTYEYNYLIYDYGTIVWNTKDVIVGEGDGECSVSFSRVNGSKDDLCLTYSFGGTAVRGVDYIFPSEYGTGIDLSNGKDNNTVTLKFNILNDNVLDGDKTIAFTLEKALVNKALTTGLPTTITITIKDDESNTLTKIITPSAISGVANGTAKNSASLGLPNQVELETSVGYAQANVLWDVDASSYDPSSKLAQTFIVNGNVILPSYVTNSSNLDLNISIEVSVNEKIPGKITVSSNSSIGGSTTGSGIYCEGDIVTVTAVANSGYKFVNWMENGIVVSTEASYTFTVGLEDRVLMAYFNAITPPDNSNGNGGGGSSMPVIATNKILTITDVKAKTTISTVFVKPDIELNGKAKLTLMENDISVAVKSAFEEAKKENKLTSAHVEIKEDYKKSVKSVETIITKKDLNLISESSIDSLTISSSIGSINFDSDAIDTITKESKDEVRITIAKVDSLTLSDEAKQIVGDRDVYNLSVVSGTNNIRQFKGDVTISVPYTLREGEDAESIVIYYINSDGKLETVTNSVYDASSGMITFTTNHFSMYAIGHNKVKFADVSESAWYYKAVNFISARNITSGTEYGKFSPDAKLTRAEFIVMIMRAYGILPDENLSNNFSDAGNTYYTGYIAVAKSLGITKGSGNNMFEPNKEITRQEMATLLYNTLNAINMLPKEADEKQLTSYYDSSLIEDWAEDAMTLFVETETINGNDNMLNPTSTATRAEMAQLLYNLLTN